MTEVVGVDDRKTNSPREDDAKIERIDSPADVTWILDTDVVEYPTVIALVVEYGTRRRTGSIASSRFD